MRTSRRPAAGEAAAAASSCSGRHDDLKLRVRLQAVVDHELAVAVRGATLGNHRIVPGLLQTFKGPSRTKTDGANATIHNLSINLL